MRVQINDVTKGRTEVENNSMAFRLTVGLVLNAH
jgi:hypothetical protein